METKKCAVCEVDGLHVCSECKETHYCSKDHQRIHWKDHKQVCKPYKVVSDDTGQYLVASRDLKPGHVILQEEPMMIGPHQAIDDEAPICLGCCSSLSGCFVNCPNCKWPMCGQKDCWIKGSQHALGECQMLKAAGDRATANSFVGGFTKGIYDSIMILRFVALRERDPAKFEKLTKIKFQGRRQNGLGVVSTRVFDLINQWLPNYNIPQELILKICAICKANNFKLSTVYGSNSDSRQGIFSVASKIDHCCIANATNSFTKTGKMIVRAAVPISKGSKILLNYLDPLFGTGKRQYLLHPTKFCSCSCQRCMDPSELGTFIGGIYCCRCPNQEGIVLSENAKDDDADWICNKCSDRKPATFYASLMRKPWEDWNALNRKSIPEMECFIDKYSKILHPHNFFLTSIKLALCQSYGATEEILFSENPMGLMADPNFVKRVQSEGDDRSDDILRKKEILALDLLQVVNIVSPGLNLMRGWILYHLFDVIQTRNNRLPKDGSILASERHSRFQTAHKLLREVHTIFSLEPKDTEEVIIAEETAEELQNIESSIRLFALEMSLE